MIPFLINLYASLATVAAVCLWIEVADMRRRVRQWQAATEQYAERAALQDAEIDVLRAELERSRERPCPTRVGAERCGQPAGHGGRCAG